MSRRQFRLLAVIACLAFPASGVAQEGHPLTGTWAGDWGAPAAARTHLTLVMNWDGQTVTGTINPGPDAIPIGRVAIDFSTWTVRIEAEAKDSGGRAVRIVAEGRLEEIGSPHRKITGKWTQGSTTGEFKVARE